LDDGDRISGRDDIHERDVSPAPGRNRSLLSSG
jgi:hypothetical protein